MMEKPLKLFIETFENKVVVNREIFELFVNFYLEHHPQERIFIKEISMWEGNA